MDGDIADVDAADIGPAAVGACCGTLGDCIDAITKEQCDDVGLGKYLGDESTCEDDCPGEGIPTVT